MSLMDSDRPSLHGRSRPGRVWSILTFERLVTGPVIHLVYWAGLGVIIIAAFSVVGAAVGVALREGSWAALLLAIPVLVGGLLAVGAAGLVWRAMCEFYVAIFRIGAPFWGLVFGLAASWLFERDELRPPT